jgi:hypothetical protein
LGGPAPFDGVAIDKEVSDVMLLQDLFNALAITAFRQPEALRFVSQVFDKTLRSGSYLSFQAGPVFN